MTIKELLFIFFSVLIVSIYFVNLGFNAEYVGLVVLLLQLIALVFVKSRYFRRYIYMREAHKKSNRKQLGVE